MPISNKKTTAAKRSAPIRHPAVLKPESTFKKVVPEPSARSVAAHTAAPESKQRPIDADSHMETATSQSLPVSLEAAPPKQVPYQEAPGEPYMASRQQTHFRQMLTQWKQQLLTDVEQTMRQLQDGAVALPDLNDRATQEETFSLELRTRNREHKLIKKIEEALRKLDRGEYGYCEREDCGAMIGIRRLEARPTAALCIDCKTLDEIREKQQGG